MNKSHEQSLLIVDDNPLNVQILADGFTQDYRVRIATRGEKALELACSETPPGPYSAGRHDAGNGRIYRL